MSALSKRLFEIIQRHELFTPHTPLMVSFSGGSDSVALVTALHQLKFKNLILVYFNHHMRSQQELQYEVDFVKKFAKEKQYPVMIRHIPIAYCMKHYPVSAEQAGHIIRKYYLQHLAKLKQAKGILTAHHKDDLEETCIHHLIRGHVFNSGLALKNTQYNTPVYRPLLSFTKFDLMSYLKTKGQFFSQDTTNADTRYTRNRIRHELLPVIKSINPKFSTFFTDFFHQLDTLYSETHPTHQAPLYETPSYWKLDLENIAKLQDIQLQGLLYNTLQHIYHAKRTKERLKDLLSHHQQLSYVHIKELCYCINKGKTGPLITLPKNYTVHVYQNSLYIVKKPLEQMPSISLPLEQWVQWASHEIRIKACKTMPDNVSSSNTHCFIGLKEEIAQFSVRFITKNDQFIPFKRQRKVNAFQYLGKQKIDPIKRQSLPCIIANQTVAWIPSCSIHNDFQVTNDSEYILQIEIRPLTTPLYHMISY